jgi:hypothetical protein
MKKKHFKAFGNLFESFTDFKGGAFSYEVVKNMINAGQSIKDIHPDPREIIREYENRKLYHSSKDFVEAYLKYWYKSGTEADKKNIKRLSKNLFIMPWADSFEKAEKLDNGYKTRYYVTYRLLFSIYG